MEVTTQTNLIFVETWIWEGDNIILGLDFDINEFSIRFEESNVLYKMIFASRMRIFWCSHPDNYLVRTFCIKRNMLEFSFGCLRHIGNFLKIFWDFLEIFFSFATMRTCPGLLKSVKKGSLGSLLIPDKRIVNI